MAFDLFKLHLIYHHSLSRSLVLKILLVSTAVAVLPFLAFDADYSSSACAVAGASGSPAPLPDLDGIFLDLIAANYISVHDRCLCIGQDLGPAAAAAMRRLGFRHAEGVSEGCGGLPFGEGEFDFVFGAGLERVRAPARVVLEMERVLVPGRSGALVTAAGTPERPKSLVRTAAPVAAMLRASDVVAVRTVNRSAVVVFRKRRGSDSEVKGEGS